MNIVEEIADSAAREWAASMNEVEQIWWTAVQGGIDFWWDVAKRPWLYIADPFFGPGKFMQALEDYGFAPLSDTVAALSSFPARIALGALAEAEDDMLFPDVPQDGVVTRRSVCAEVMRQLGRAGIIASKANLVPSIVGPILRLNSTPMIVKLFTKTFDKIISGAVKSRFIRLLILLVDSAYRIALGVCLVVVAVIVWRHLKGTNGKNIKCLKQTNVRKFTKRSWRTREKR